MNYTLGMNNKMAITKTQLNRAKIAQHNAFIESCYRMSITEKRIINVFVSQLRSDGINDISNTMLIDTETFNDTFGVKDSRKEIAKAIDTLFSKTIRIRSEFIDKNGKVWNKGARFTIVSSALYNDSLIQLSFNREIMPYLEELKGSYTLYALKDSAKLSSIYSIRFYEFFKQYEKFGKREFTIEEIRDIFDLKNKYKSKQDLYRRVVELSVNDINKNTPMSVKVEPVKIRRTITGYKFTFHTILPSNKSKLEAFLKKVEPIFKRDMNIVIGGKTVYNIGKEEDGTLLAMTQYENIKLLPFLIENDFEFTKVDGNGIEIKPWKNLK